MRKKYKHRKIVNEISKELNMDPRVVHLIIRKFFDGIRKLMSKNEDINIKGFFILKLAKSYRKKVEKEGRYINLRKRKDQKKTYVKKT